MQQIYERIFHLLYHRLVKENDEDGYAEAAKNMQNEDC